MKGTITSITTISRGDVVILTVEVKTSFPPREFKIRTRSEAELLVDEIESLKRTAAAHVFHLGDVDIRQNDASPVEDRIEYLQSKLNRLNAGGGS
jgi:hypothetical protein